jgi:hypothetical protein
MTPSLLDYITYIPAERDQGACGNCYAWTGTAMLEVKHAVETGVHDRLSVQWFDSNLYGFTPPNSPTSFGNACPGGNVQGILSLYTGAWLEGTTWYYTNNHIPLVPWSNKDAQFQDGNWNGQASSPPAVAASAISSNPDYSVQVDSMYASTVPTTGVSQAKAIANIQNELLQKKAVSYFFSMATDGGMAAFKNWWFTQPETAIWDPDSYCNESGQGMDSHYTTIVGYDASDPNPDNHYWLVLNSWGMGTETRSCGIHGCVTSYNRPNGLYRLKMNMNYGCAEERWFENFETWSGKQPFTDTNAFYMAVDNATTGDIDYRENPGSWRAWTATTRATSTTPVLVTFNTRQYMVAKDPNDNNLYLRSMGASGSWTSWTQIYYRGLLLGTSYPITADGTPALVVYRDNLYLFAKAVGSNTIQYSVMNYNGVWSPWVVVPSSNTGHSPAVAVYNDQIQLFEIDSSGVVAMNSMSSDGTWAGWAYLGWKNVVSDAAPAAAMWNGMLWVLVKEKTSDVIDYAYATGDPRGGTWVAWTQIPGNAHTAHSPAIAQDRLATDFCAAITGQTSTTLYMQCYVAGRGWGGTWTSTPFGGVGSKATPSLNTYWFPGAGVPRVGVAQE